MTDFNRRMALVGWRLQAALGRFMPWVVAVWGTDCDGMRWEAVSRTWLKRHAEREADWQVDSADGPVHSAIYRAWSSDGRALVRNGLGWADGIDRYAEREGY